MMPYKNNRYLHKAELPVDSVSWCQTLEEETKQRCNIHSARGNTPGSIPDLQHERSETAEVKNKLSSHENDMLGCVR